jgi:hypothetical protein
MTKKRAGFRWSDEQIKRATRPRAIDIYDEEEEQVRRDLITEGVRAVAARRRGGRTFKKQSSRAMIRRTIISEVYKDNPGLRKTPTADQNLDKVRKILATRYNFNYSRETIRKDVLLIGAEQLRGR